MLRSLVFVILAGLVIVIGRVLFTAIPATGQFATFETVAVETCERVEVAPGPEDIQIDHETGLAYIATTDRRDPDKDRRIGIHVLDLNTPGARPQQLEGDLPEGFVPHGVSLWRGENGERRLFVVNLHRGHHAIEIFQIDEGNSLTHLETVTSEHFTAPNDLVAVGPRQFYVSNMQRSTGGVSLLAEQYLALPVTNVVYFDGNKAASAADGLISANGLNVSADGAEVYVAEPIARRINVYKRDLATGELSGRKRFPIGTGPDNIDVAPDGSLYIGSHPNLLAFIEHAGDPKAISPSHVVRLDPVSGEHETVFMSIDGEIDGSSTGPYWNGNLLVGGVFESHIMWCREATGAT